MHHTHTQWISTCARTTHSLRKCAHFDMCRQAIYAHSIHNHCMPSMLSHSARRSCPDVCMFKWHFWTNCQSSVELVMWNSAYLYRLSFTVALPANSSSSQSQIYTAKALKWKVPDCHQWLWENYAVNLLAHNWVVAIWKFLLTPFVCFAYHFLCDLLVMISCCCHRHHIWIRACKERIKLEASRIRREHAFICLG